MPDVERFVIFMAAAFLLFVGVRLFVTRKRNEKPGAKTLMALGTIVVVVGMIFADIPIFHFGIYLGRSTTVSPH